MKIACWYYSQQQMGNRRVERAKNRRRMGNRRTQNRHRTRNRWQMGNRRTKNCRQMGNCRTKIVGKWAIVSK